MDITVPIISQADDVLLKVVTWCLGVYVHAHATAHADPLRLSASVIARVKDS